MTRLDAAVLRLWLAGENASTVIRHARHLGSTIETDADVERLADAAGGDWRAERRSAIEERNRCEAVRTMGMTEDDLMDDAMDCYGNLPAEDADALRAAVALDGDET